MQAKLLTLNEPTLNGRTYPTDVMQAAIEKYVASGKPMVVCRHFKREREADLKNVCGVIENIECRGNELIGTVKVFPGEEGLLNLSVRPTFIGKVSEDGIVTEAELLSFTFTAEPA